MVQPFRNLEDNDTKWKTAITLQFEPTAFRREAPPPAEIPTVPLASDARPHHRCLDASSAGVIPPTGTLVAWQASAPSHIARNKCVFSGTPPHHKHKTLAPKRRPDKTRHSQGERLSQGGQDLSQDVHRELPSCTTRLHHAKRIVYSMSWKSTHHAIHA